MVIKNIFLKDLFRPINGVVKADQQDEAIVWQELDEYVVTKELDIHFRRVLRRLPRRSIDTADDPTSPGRSACLDLRVLRLRQVPLPEGPVLPAREQTPINPAGGQVDRRAVEFFESKIQDAMLLGDIKRAVARETDVILFNIDSKADAATGATPCSRVPRS